MREKLLDAFRKEYGEDADSCYFAPGRINLIGEHTDYNGGHVFPCALTFGTYVAVRRRGGDTLRLASLSFPDDGVLSSCIMTLTPRSENSWTSYVKGVIWAVSRKASSALSGMDIMISGDVPAGAGLSSSASLEVAVGYMLNDQFSLGLSNMEIALLSQKAENEFVGVSCGIMDQFASAMGKKDHAIYLDTNTLEYSYVPLALTDCSIIITNTNKPHSLNDSAYNDRRRECGEALAEIDSYLEESGAAAGGPRKAEALCGMSIEEFSAASAGITDPVVLSRARHAVTEDQRTRDAVKVLRAGDIGSFGKLMNASHISLRDDYEVSCPELDLLAETAWETPGVLGSRMTGGGFGGCTVSIIRDGAVEEYEKKAAERYREAFGYDCTFIRAAAGGGPERI